MATTVKKSNPRQLFVSSVIAVMLVGLILLFLFLAFIDLRYFGLEKQVRSWSQRNPPSAAQLDYVHQGIDQLWREKNPNLLWLEAIVYEWDAYLDNDNSRFYLIKSEGLLRQAISLRPKDARMWAHLAIILDKQSKPVSNVRELIDRALLLGGKDKATHSLLSYFDQSNPRNRLGVGYFGNE